MKTIAVIGLGPSGLVAVKELKTKGFHVTGFDKQDKVGGIWAEPGKHGIFKELTLNTSRSYTEYSDFPWNKEDYPGFPEDDGGVFASGAEYGAYLANYAKHFDLESNFQLKTEVTSIQRKEQGGYVATTSRGTQEFDAVVVCSGRNATPNNPLQEKFSNFSGTVIHSQQVESLAEFDAKSVLIVGAAVSASDLSSRLGARGKCKTLVNSVRKVPYHLDKFSKNGEACEHFMFLRLVAWISGYLPESMRFQGLKGALLRTCPEQITKEITQSPELVLDSDIRNAGISYTSGYVSAAKNGLFTIKPQVQSVKGEDVTFIDGSTQSFDVIVCCTGFTGWDLSILPPEIVDKVKYVSPAGFIEPALYMRTLVPSITDMTFVGLPNIGAMGPLAELQARYAASLLSGDLSRPSDDRVLQGAMAFRKHRDAGPYNRNDMTPRIQEEIGSTLGVTPTVFEAMVNARTLLFGQMYPCYYRMKEGVDGKEVAAKAKERWVWCHEHPMVRVDKQE
jgi:dimethylaniline monooxygenase (N-oxide forming)